MINFFTTFFIHNKQAIWKNEHINRIVEFAQKTKIELDKTKLEIEFNKFLEKTNSNGRGRIIVENSIFRFDFSKIKPFKPLTLTLKEVEEPLGNIKKFPFQNLGLKENQEFILVEKKTQEVLEGNFTNIFLLKNGYFLTPIADNKILNGICRQKFIKYLKLKKIKVEEKKVYYKDLKNSKIFLTNSLRGVIKTSN